MIKSIKNKYKISIFVVLILGLLVTNKGFCANPIGIVIDGKEVKLEVDPILENDRTLVPIRFITEAMGGEVEWDEVNREVNINKSGKKINLKLDSKVYKVTDSASLYGVSDIAPKLIKDRTFVPLRLVSNGLGLNVDWDNSNRKVIIDSSKESNFQEVIRIDSVKNQEVISGKKDLKVELVDRSKNIDKIEYLLINPKTREGRVISRGQIVDKNYTFLPKDEDAGDKILAALVYDKNNNLLGGDAKIVKLSLNKSLGLKVDSNKEGAKIIPEVNFVANYIDYNIENKNTGKIKEILKQDPYGPYSFASNIEDNGEYIVEAIAYDNNGKGFKSDKLEFKVNVDRKLFLSGLKDGMIVDNPVSLIAVRNFNVSNTKFIMKDVKTGEETIIGDIPYGNYTWFPGEDVKGSKEVYVQVTDTKGVNHKSPSVKVNLPGKTIIQLNGVGPNQVLSDDAELGYRGNREYDSVEYIIKNKTRGKEVVLKGNKNNNFKANLNAKEIGEGNIEAYVRGKYGNKVIDGEKISFRIYLRKTFTKGPVAEKDKFLGIASEMGVKASKKTGMSAAIQTAQAVHETGWGQSVGVDKYTGKMSYNLFGIKGEGPAGSVIIRTFEVYNGVRYDIDDKFRAYNSMQDSWDDHKKFLLERERYEIFKDVMYDSTQGAWALKRAGYATDPEYALKLINLINRYNLNDLDKIKL